MKRSEGRGGRAARSSAARAPAGVARDALEGWLNDYLQPGAIEDYCPNGLQVEGSPQIRKLACGVTASLAFVQAAAQSGAQAVLVHHGWFWRGEDPCVTGARHARLSALMTSGMSLFAYHLPLDVHAEVGNNVALARHLGWPVGESFGRQGLIRMTSLPAPSDAAGLGRLLQRRLARKPLLVGALDRPIRRIAWCTGAAHDFLPQAIEAGADAFVSGEISERTTHLAREAGVIYASAGHHATERYGVQALGARVAEQFGIEVVFIDDPNPV